MKRTLSKKTNLKLVRHQGFRSKSAAVLRARRAKGRHKLAPTVKYKGNQF